MGNGEAGHVIQQNQPGSETATFGGGCFWGVEKWFLQRFPDIKTSAVGYQGGSVSNPGYRLVCTGNTGHAEVFRITYEPDDIDYADLVHYFYALHDPTTLNRQGNDRGTQYRSVIFYHSDEQKRIAEEVTQRIIEENRYKNDIVTQIENADDHEFFAAEDYHQQYLHKNPGGYCNHKPRWDA
eukprot:TRINITY_DN795_c0_g1_i1.p1 TRINITY_DN795_c0_g1~~TRINITY_DN795_c0_g1_i1.p1  ORF type:complete len:182 (-),score=40.19 TRINITY_DN795_c0_g1_i1:30-575(-)